MFLLLTLAGFVLLALSLPRHHRDMFGTTPPEPRSRWLRATGWALLALSPIASITVFGWAVGLVFWVGGLMVAAFCVALFFTYAAKFVGAFIGIAAYRR